MLASLFFIIAHYQKINRFPSTSNVLRVFTMNEWRIWSNAFSIFIKMVMWWILFFFFPCYCGDLHWFSYVTPVLNSWSQCIVLSVHFWFWLANTLRIFFFSYIHEEHWWYSYLMFLPDFGIKVIPKNMVWGVPSISVFRKSFCINVNASLNIWQNSLVNPHGLVFFMGRILIRNSVSLIEIGLSDFFYFFLNLFQ